MLNSKSNHCPPRRFFYILFFLSDSFLNFKKPIFFFLPASPPFLCYFILGCFGNLQDRRLEPTTRQYKHTHSNIFGLLFFLSDSVFTALVSQFFFYSHPHRSCVILFLDVFGKINAPFFLLTRFPTTAHHVDFFTFCFFIR